MSKSRSLPEELIKIKAHEIWEKRQREGRDGTPEGDWIKAKKYLEKHWWEVYWWKLKRIPTTIYKPYYLLEKRVLEPVDAWIKRQASISILTQLAILAAIVAFIGGENVRRNNEVFSAWQTITSAEGQTGSGGRIEALEFLNSRPWRFPWIGWTEEEWFWDENKKECNHRKLPGFRWERQPLTGLSAPGAYLADVKLCGASLENAYLIYANLRSANLGWTILVEAELVRANLWGADLKRANLGVAILVEAELVAANLGEAILAGADLRRAILTVTRLNYADLRFANLGRANLEGANFEKSELFGKVQNLTPTQVKFACNWQQAKFDEEFQKALAKEPDQEVDCSKWER